MNTLMTCNMKYFNILFMTIIAIVTVAACVSGMSVLFDSLSMPGLPWYTMISLTIGNCFLGYFGILVIWLYINYITLKIDNK